MSNFFSDYITENSEDQKIKSPREGVLHSKRATLSAPKISLCALKCHPKGSSRHSLAEWSRVHSKSTNCSLTGTGRDEAYTESKMSLARCY